MPIPVYAWTAVLVVLARILHLRVAIAAPGTTIIVPVPQAAVIGLAAVVTVTALLIVRSLRRPGVVRGAA